MKKNNKPKILSEKEQDIQDMIDKIAVYMESLDDNNFMFFINAFKAKLYKMALERVDIGGLPH